MAGFRKLMPQITSGSVIAGKQDAQPRQTVVDSAPWALSREFEQYMNSLGIQVRNKNSSNRQELQNNSVIDAAIAKLQRILKERQKNNPAWVTHVAATTTEYNNTKHLGAGMLGSEPAEVPGSKLIRFNLQEASGDALAESQKAVDRAKVQLDKEGAFKEATKDKQELAGRGARRAADGEERVDEQRLRVLLQADEERRLAHGPQDELAAVVGDGDRAARRRAARCRPHAPRRRSPRAAARARAARARGRADVDAERRRFVADRRRRRGRRRRGRRRRRRPGRPSPGAPRRGRRPPPRLSQCDSPGTMCDCPEGSASGVAQLGV